MNLLLLPGMDGTGRLFAPLVDALPPSLSGRVGSYPNDVPSGYRELLPIVSAAVDGLGDFIVVGESYSGPLALMLAAQRPAGLHGVVLCASFVRPPRRWLALAQMIVRPWMFRLTPTQIVGWALLGRHRHGPLGTALKNAIQSVAPAVMAARMKAIATVNVTRDLCECPVPVLDLHADRDRLVPLRCGALIRSLQPDSETVVLPGPHLLFQAAPQESARALATFSARVG